MTTATFGGRSVERRNRRAFTLIELLIVVAIISLLVSLLLPSLDQARETARAVACLSNERQQGVAMNAYAYEAMGRYPPASFHRTVGLIWSGPLHDWRENLVSGEYLTPTAFVCPSGRETQWNGFIGTMHQGLGVEVHYSVNYGAIRNYDVGWRHRVTGITGSSGSGPTRVSEILRPSDLIMIGGSYDTYPQSGIGIWLGLDSFATLQWGADTQGNTRFGFQHMGEPNFLFADGRATSIALAKTWGSPQQQMWWNLRDTARHGFYTQARWDDYWIMVSDAFR